MSSHFENSDKRGTVISMSRHRKLTEVRKHSPGSKAGKRTTASHEAQCHVCRHPKCKDIENGYVAWRPLGELSEEFAISEDSIVNHATFKGLLKKRSENDRGIFVRIAEMGFRGLDPDKITGANVINAAEAMVRMRGGFSDNTNISILDQASEIGERYANMNSEEKKAKRQKLLEELSNPQKRPG